MTRKAELWAHFVDGRPVATARHIQKQREAQWAVGVLGREVCLPWDDVDWGKCETLARDILRAVRINRRYLSTMPIRSQLSPGPSSTSAPQSAPGRPPRPTRLPAIARGGPPRGGGRR